MALDDDIAKIMGSGQIDPEQERQRRLMSILTASLGALGARRGYEAQDISHAGLLGLQTYSQMGLEQQQEAARRMQQQSAAMDVLTKRRTLEDSDLTRQIQRDYLAQNGPMGSAPPQPAPNVPTAPSTAAAFTQDPSAAARNAGVQADPTGVSPPVNTATAAPAPQPQPAMTSPGLSYKRQLAQQYRGLAQALQAKGGDPNVALSYEQKAASLEPQLKETKTYGDPQNPRGRIVVNMYADGSHEVLHDVAPEPEKLAFHSTGGALAGLDPISGQQMSSTPMSMTPGESARMPIELANLKIAQANSGISAGHLAETIRHNQVSEGDPQVIEATAQGIASGKLQPLSGWALGRPMGQSIMARVVQINPEFDPQQYQVGLAAEKNFTQGKLGTQVRSFNVGLAHLDTLGQLSDALGNKDYRLLNQAMNLYKTQTGDAAPTNFDAAKQIVSNEIVKAIVGSGGGVGDRDKAQAAVSAASSPAQLKGVIDTYKTLMVGQLQGLQQQYEQGTRKQDFQRFLSPEALRLMQNKNAVPDVRKRADEILMGK